MKLGLLRVALTVGVPEWLRARGRDKLEEDARAGVGRRLPGDSVIGKYRLGCRLLPEHLS
jgi:hypothetical protein